MGDKKEKLLMKTERIISNTKVMVTLFIVGDLLLWLALNYILNFFLKFPLVLKDLDNPGKYISFKYVFPNLDNIENYTTVYLVVYGILFIFCLIVNGVSAYKIKTSMGEKYINVGQKGVARWTTNEEIKEQYKEIPDKDKSFPGYGGTIVSRIGNKLYIDDSPTNNLIIGITRSGKGEMFVFPSIDVYSRAEEKASIVAIDPKLEGYKSSKKTLEERGYDVYLLNLDDPEHSMGFNPLEQITRTYLEKDYAAAELLTQAFSYSIFNPDAPTNTDAFWQDTASSLLSALILAHVEDCIKADEMENVRRYEVWKEKREAFDKLNDVAKGQAIDNWKKAKADNIKDVVMKRDIKYLPPEEQFVMTGENYKKINMYSILNTFTELARMKDPMNPDITALDRYFNLRESLNRAKLKYAGIEIAGDRTKASIYASMLAKLTIFTYEKVAKMTAESSIKLEDIGFGDKPIAVFMGIPDYDKSTHFLATVFIRQLYFVLAKKATESKTGKCPNKVKIIADEFGNIPAIQSMETIITVCLGRNISFDMFIQSYSQLTKLYGDDAETIEGNCGNQIYILTNDKDTAEKFSDLIGSETIIDVQRSGERLSLNKQFSETPADRLLLDKNQLMELYEGECVVKRVMKRQDNERQRVRPTPIFNSEESGKRFLYRYEYLTDTFPNPDEIDLDEINNEDRSFINLKERVWDYDTTFKWLNFKEIAKNTKSLTLKELTNYEQLNNALKKALNEKINGETTVVYITDKISKSDLSRSDKDALLSLIKLGESG